MIRNPCLCQVLVATFLLAAVARAEPAPAAEALFQAGREAARQGHFAEACAKFSESQRLEPALGTRLNLALCEEELGHLAEAWALFRALARSLPRDDERMELVESHAANLAVRVPTLSLRAGAELPPGSRVEVAGLSVTPSAFGVAIPVNPGPLALRVFAPGFETRVYELTLAEGEKAQLSVEPGPRLHESAARSLPALPTLTALSTRPSLSAPPRVPARPGQPLRVSGMIGLGVAGSALIGSVVAGYVALRNKRTVDSECDSSGACSAAGLSAARSGKRFASLSTASFALSVVFAAGGTSLLLVANAQPAAANAPLGQRVPGLQATWQGTLP
jgi:hypothetical protein